MPRTRHVERLFIAGGFIPLLPYILLHEARKALYASVAATLAALLIFGFIKGHFTGARPLSMTLQTVLIGGVAAGAAFLTARAIS